MVLRIFVAIVMVLIGSSNAFAKGNHCIFDIRPSDWPLLRYGSASAYFDAVEGWCERGDHLLVQRMYTEEAGYFIAVICDPLYSIDVIDLKDNYSSLTCVYAGLKEDRLD